MLHLIAADGETPWSTYVKVHFDNSIIEFSGTGRGSADSSVEQTTPPNNSVEDIKEIDNNLMPELPLRPVNDRPRRGIIILFAKMSVMERLHLPNHGRNWNFNFYCEAAPEVAYINFKLLKSKQTIVIIIMRSSSRYEQFRPGKAPQR
ncbi:hypothetical protein AJ78_06557 [Emergomyces pasteurianus Ep9510]|uniref:Uncharacterized protein n=1 Tax=Emergomyces pasteurianus Ep9510 TaxID=1447872 RepID=A0A1J9P8V3_9EURO|nr:hypothetical protein AJ78_06557 [Emergomyces pasteurianus Ep9510]